MKRTGIVLLIVALCVLGVGAAYAAAQKPDVEDTPVGAEEDGLEGVLQLTGTVVGVEFGIDGISAALDCDGDLYDVTISVIQVELFGRFEEIVEGAQIQVTGEVIAGMDPPLVVADRVTVLGAEPDYVLNLRGTVTEIAPGKDGITATVTAADGTEYSATISLVTSETVYIGEEESIEIGTPVWLTGELFDLDGPHIKVDVAVVNPIQ